ncbi:PREDICTED: heavy metal-associated isoprenylated plant protein 3-like isoform X2 [Camelina sativa]|uniref:Heavy metal-associated isoprenylated plant protein 3-like isoform X2 n=1 Tax=Camelina sativa TaxID=90675 RepID=A0ABM0UKP8_CAMSA|nr:PREDICTED: heavy metal-associated isoprenylated plant protein 3-like isoform X2 [Camelina sativa]
MGEEDKKMEEKKAEEPQLKPEDKKPEEEEKKKEPQDIVLKIFMHCEGCAKKIHRCLKGFEGVEDVTTDCKTSKVVVKGEKADPLKVLERLQRKSHRQVELLSPVPEPKPVPNEPEKKEEEKPKPEEKKEEVVTVVLSVHMHCEACAMEIQKRIMRMKGVESVEPDFKASQVSVKGVFTPEKLVEFVYKRVGKHAAVVKQDPPPKPPEKEKETKDKEEKKKEDGQPKEGKEAKEDGGAKGDGGAAVEGNIVVDLKKNEYQYQPPRYPVEMFAYPPQIFSDENPNTCTIM